MTRQKVISAENPVFIDIVTKIVEALTPLQLTATKEVIAAIDVLALAIMKSQTQ